MSAGYLRSDQPDEPAEQGRFCAEVDRLFRYRPDYATHPGELIVEMREEAGLKQAHLAGAARISPKHLCQVEKGVKPLTARVAVEIEIALGKRCADTLMAMQGYYDVHAEREAQRARVVAISSLLVEP